MRLALLGGVVAVAAVVTVPAPPAAAETTVKSNGNVVTITIPVDVVGAEDKTSPDGSMSLVDYWEKILNDTWGAAFNTIPYKNCYLFELKLKLTAQGREFDSTKGRHRILVGAPTGGLTFDGTGFDGTEETSRDHTTGDGTRSLEHDRDGAIPVDAAPTVVAHEFGHLFGLGQDSENGAPKSGHDVDDVMVGGVPGTDLNQAPDIDKKVVDRIGKIIERYLKDQNKKPLAKCQSWTGTLDSEHTVAGACAFTWSGAFEFGVVEHEVIGSATVSPDGGCAAVAGTVTVTGTADDDGFTLSSDSYILAAGTRVEKTAPDRAEGMSEYHDAYNDVITTFEMECKKNCDEDAVG